MAITPPPSATGGYKVSDFNVSPIQRSAVPVGSIAEAERENLSPTEYATCCRPNPVNGVIGCSWFAKCRVSAKGESGPKNYGIEVMHPKAVGGDFVRFNTDCMWIADHIDDLERNGGALKVVANEGEDLEIVTGILVSNATGDPTFDRDPNAHRETRRVKVKVPAYPRPGENPMLLTDVLRAESIEAEKERRSDEARARGYGLESTISPVDKRDARSDGGRKAPGGGKP